MVFAPCFFAVKLVILTGVADMEQILSGSNRLIKSVRRLSGRRQREKEQKFLVEGIRFVEEAVNSGWPLEVVLTGPGFSGPGRDELLAKVHFRGVRVVEVSAAIIAELAETESPQGILAVAAMPGREAENLWPGQRHAALVVVDGVQDPGNLGTIIRSADAFGAGGVLLTRGTVDLYNPKTLRSTMGSVFHLPVLPNLDVEYIAGLLMRHGVSLVLGDPGADVPLSSVDLTGPVALLVGSEARGPSGEFMRHRHIRAGIPMPGRAESLNAGVAASVMLYEMARQRGFGPS
jgi:TrmH family RNA methyltransferase